tara:strand:+ start:97 stop:390 length:294 start_codon:yes stop_codon:yes gene_type:complete
MYIMYIGMIIRLNRSLTSWNPLTFATSNSLGNDTCCIKEELRMSWDEPLDTVLEKALKMSIPNIMFNGNSLSGLPRNITNTKKNTIVKKIGSRSVQA